MKPDEGVKAFSADAIDKIRKSFNFCAMFSYGCKLFVEMPERDFLLFFPLKNINLNQIYKHESILDSPSLVLNFSLAAILSIIE